MSCDACPRPDGRCAAGRREKGQINMKPEGNNFLYEWREEANWTVRGGGVDSWNREKGKVRR